MKKFSSLSIQVTIKIFQRCIMLDNNNDYSEQLKYFVAEIPVAKNQKKKSKLYKGFIFFKQRQSEISPLNQQSSLNFVLHIPTKLKYSYELDLYVNNRITLQETIEFFKQPLEKKTIKHYLIYDNESNFNFVELL